MKISVLIPVCNSRHYLKQAIQSIQSQTFTDWEMLVINEYSSKDGSAELVRRLAQQDARIRLIQNKKSLGLAESLNEGMRLASGDYIARMDADDLSFRTRFQKQAAFLDAHPDISLCGTYQRYFGPDISWVHRPALEPERCKASLLFDCDLCHSTVMLRRRDFLERGLLYDKHYLAEDFELWSRALTQLKFANIPEILGAYRVNGENITAQKKERMAKEHAYIIAGALERNLKLTVTKEQYRLLEGWGNPYYQEKNRAERKRMYKELERLLRRIYKRNQTVGFYDDKALLEALNDKWRYAKYMEPKRRDAGIQTVDEIFNSRRRPDYRLLWRTYWERHTSLRADVKRLGRYVKARL